MGRCSVKIGTVILRYVLLTLAIALIGIAVNWTLGSFERPNPQCQNTDALGHVLNCQ